MCRIDIDICICVYVCFILYMKSPCVYMKSPCVDHAVAAFLTWRAEERARRMQDDSVCYSCRITNADACRMSWKPHRIINRTDVTYIRLLIYLGCYPRRHHTPRHTLKTPAHHTPQHTRNAHGSHTPRHTRTASQCKNPSVKLVYNSDL